MTESPHIAHLRRLVDDEDDDVLSIVGDVEPLLNCNEVTAVCRSIMNVYFGAFRKSKWVFKFEVVDPAYHGTNLHMFASINPLWRKGRRIPRSSKLFICASIALGRRLEGRDHIAKSAFIGKLFRCRLRQVGAVPTNYTVIDTLLEKLTG